MALNTEPIVTQHKVDTSDFERAERAAAESMAKTAQHSDKMQQQFERNSKSLVRDTAGMVGSLDMLSRTSKVTAANVAMLAHDIGDFASSAAKSGSKWAGLLTVVGNAAPWIMVAGAVTAVGKAVIDWAADAEAGAKRMQKILAELNASSKPPEWVDRKYMSEETEALPEWLKRQRGRGRVSMARGGIVTGNRRTRALDEMEVSEDITSRNLELFGGGQLQGGLGSDRIAAENQAQFDSANALVEQQLETNRANYEANLAMMEEYGIDPALGVAGGFLGNNPELQAERMNATAASMLSMQQNVKNLGSMFKGAGAAGAQSFFATIAMGKGAGEAFKELTKSMLMAISMQAAAQGAMDLAMGFSNLIFNPPLAATKFKSAGLFFALAGATALGTSAFAGGGSKTTTSTEVSTSTGNGGGTGFRQSSDGKQEIIVYINVPPGGESRAGEAYVDAITAHERERGRNVYVREHA